MVAHLHTLLKQFCFLFYTETGHRGPDHAHQPGPGLGDQPPGLQRRPQPPAHAQLDDAGGLPAGTADFHSAIYGDTNHRVSCME